MSQTQTQPLPSTRSLFKATAIAIAAAAVLLVAIVLPAEYGIDPTGIGRSLGLDVLGQAAQTEKSSSAGNDELAAKADAAFGKSAGRSLDAAAVSVAGNAQRSDKMTVTLEPGKGTEVKALLKAGEGLTFRWQASDDVAIDMHGEAPGAKGTWTSYAVEAAQRKAAGTFVAPFEGSHGWYWENRSAKPVTVNIEVFGFQTKLYQP